MDSTPISSAGIPLAPVDQDTTGAPRMSTHTVVAGENMPGIAKAHGLSVDELLWFNLQYNYPTLAQYSTTEIEGVRYSLEFFLQNYRSGESLRQVQIMLRPGQILFIPAARSDETRCQEVFRAADTGTAQSVMSCQDSRGREHEDPLYVFTDTYRPLEDYSYAGRPDVIGESAADILRAIAAGREQQQRLAQSARLERAIEEGSAITAATARAAATASLVDPLWDRSNKLTCGLWDTDCQTLKGRLVVTANMRESCVNDQLLTGGRTYFLETDLAQAITACEKQHPAP